MAGAVEAPQGVVPHPALKQLLAEGWVGVVRCGGWGVGGVRGVGGEVRGVGGEVRGVGGEGCGASRSAGLLQSAGYAYPPLLTQDHTLTSSSSGQAKATLQVKG